MSYKQTQAFFPFVPEHMTWEDWNGNFIMWYGQENIPYMPNENDWQMVAQNIARSPTFGKYPVPNPLTYDNWQDWARETTLIINGPSR
jgi:hypothetical protein